MAKKIISIVGARPQFVKACVVTKALKRIGLNPLTIHTGQHYDYNMSDVFFEELGMDQPDYHLNVGSGGHGEQTGKILIECERVLEKERPDLVIVYGDTNSTIGGALSAVKLHIPVAHVEAGLRSYLRAMPEEVNRVLTDQVSELLFVPSEVAVENLYRESITENVHMVGDVMYDLALKISRSSQFKEEEILGKFEVRSKEYLLVTVHRAENTDSREKLLNIIESLQSLAAEGCTVLFPVHPRTKQSLINHGVSIEPFSDRLILCEPVSYVEMLALEKNARVIVTDSGGVQKEAYYFQVPAVLPRSTTEWAELARAGWAAVTGPDTRRIIDAVQSFWENGHAVGWKPFYGNGDASMKIAAETERYLFHVQEVLS